MHFQRQFFYVVTLIFGVEIKKKTALKRVFHGLSNEVLNDKIHRLPNFGVRTYGIFKKPDFEM